MRYRNIDLININDFVIETIIAFEDDGEMNPLVKIYPKDNVSLCQTLIIKNADILNELGKTITRLNAKINRSINTKKYIRIRDMKIKKIASNNSTVEILSLDSFVNNLPEIKNNELNVVSIRDSLENSSKRNKMLYERIDSANLANIYVAYFDDVVDPFPNSFGLIFPTQTEISNILNWANKKWNENHKSFVVHCTAGVSRSSSVAILISQLINNNYKNVFHPALHSPNEKVLEFGENHLGVNNIKDNVKKELRQYDKKMYGEQNLL